MKERYCLVHNVRHHIPVLILAIWYFFSTHPRSGIKLLLFNLLYFYISASFFNPNLLLFLVFFLLLVGGSRLVSNWIVRPIIFCVLQVWCYERGVLAGRFLKVVNFGQLERLENEPSLRRSIKLEGNVAEKLNYFTLTMLL